VKVIDYEEFQTFHMIDVATVASWTDGILPEPSLTELVPRTGDKISLGEKMIYVWKERDIDNFARPFVSDATRGGVHDCRRRVCGREA
jgi:hypothetical protein